MSLLKSSSRLHGMKLSFVQNAFFIENPKQTVKILTFFDVKSLSTMTMSLSSYLFIHDEWQQPQIVIFVENLKIGKAKKTLFCRLLFCLKI